MAACGGNGGSTAGATGTTTGAASAGAGKLQVVTTIFPEYDWIRQILGENPEGVELTLLLDNGADLHSYQPTAEDIARISTCDLFVYVGGESDEWVDDALKEATNKNMVVVDLLDVLGDTAKQEEVVEGMQEDHDHDHDHGDADHEDADADHDHDHEDADHEDVDHDDDHHRDSREIEYDEHVWLSLRNAKLYVNTLSEKLAALDPAHADTYRKNAETYAGKLEQLDGQYSELFKNAGTKTLLFGDRFPFRYMIEDYGLSYYAAFIGCSAETEASFETITFLAGKVDELQLKNIFVLEGSNHKIAETVKNSTKSRDQEIVELNSMQSITIKDVESGITYLDLMQKNYEALSGALK
ncbi:MAG: metal ABC transporter substrate-binding protein [Eubacterium sp.]|nr:metal ABC transporter substrate-binding protein [Eubacterium sp.]